MATRIKVDRLLLIAALEAELKVVKKANQALADKTKQSNEAYSAKLAAAMETMMQNIRKGKMPKVRRWNESELLVTGLPVPPSERAKDGAACEIARLVKVLQLSTEKVLTIGEDSAYLKFACKI